MTLPLVILNQTFDSQLIYGTATVSWHLSLENVLHACLQKKAKFDGLTSNSFDCCGASWQLSMKSSKNETTHAVLGLRNCSVDKDKVFSYIAYFKYDILDKSGKALCEYPGQMYKFLTGNSEKVADLNFVMYKTFVEERELVISFKLWVKDMSISVNRIEPNFEVADFISELPDVVLKLGDYKFIAHKAILSSRSEVFRAMFDHDVQENRYYIVHLVGMEAETVQHMLCYFYTGRKRFVHLEEAYRLYAIAHRYDVQDMLRSCRFNIFYYLSLDTIFEMATFSDLYSDKVLMDAIKSLLLINAETLFKSEKWMSLCREKPNLAVTLSERV